MQLPDDITETSTISELTTPTINTDNSSVLSVDSSTTGTSSDNSSSSDSMEASDDDSSDSMSLSSDDTNEDSSSDYHPSSSEDEIHSEDLSTDVSSDSSTIMDTSEEELSEEEQQITKKRKRNPLDSFCLYTIRPKCPNDTNLYIGSTVCFNRRKQQHKKAVTNKRGGTYYCILYRYIRKCGGWDNFTMEKILDFPCETKQEGLLKEKEYIIKHEATLNSVMPVSDFTERMNDI
jgi:predicted GIY-YIG superfamily endonuclease